jgi:Lon protease-like protein
VVLIQEGEETGAVATTATVGCSARIVDFYTLEDGFLGIACVGERKFRVKHVWREADGLNMAEITWLADEPGMPLPGEYAQLGDAVRRALDELAEQYQHVAKNFDDAAWVGARLTELLPLQLPDKQVMLELDDPVARLAALVKVVPVTVPGEGSGEKAS